MTNRHKQELRVWLTHEQHEMIEKLVMIRRTSKSEVVRQILEDYLKFVSRD